MALLESEVQRIKYELGYPILTNNADPYIGIVALFETVITEWTQAGATTTSSTTVSAASLGTPCTLTLASATGFYAGARVFLDVGERQESVFVQSLSGATISLIPQKLHSGTYPVTVDGGEGIVRELLNRIVEARAPLSSLLAGVASERGQLKKADDVEFYQSSASFGASTKALERQVAIWRDELASALGVRNLHSSGCSTLSVY